MKNKAFHLLHRNVDWHCMRMHLQYNISKRTCKWHHMETLNSNHWPIDVCRFEHVNDEQKKVRCEKRKQKQARQERRVKQLYAVLRAMLLLYEFHYTVFTVCERIHPQPIGCTHIDDESEWRLSSPGTHYTTHTHAYTHRAHWGFTMAWHFASSFAHMVNADTVVMHSNDHSHWRIF